MALTASYGASATMLPLTDTDLGSPPIAGSASYSASDGTYTLNGSGAIGGSALAGNFDYLQLSGDFDISVGRLNGSRFPVRREASWPLTASTPKR